jgi:hypothetical protein
MKKTQALPFFVVLSRKGETSERLFATRLRSYGRHEDPLQNSAHFRKHLADDQAVLISAECKVSGECLGSVRVESNIKEQFYFESEITIPDLSTKASAVCISRLNVTNGPQGRLARAAICKALYLYSHALQCEHMYAFVDKPRARLYTTLGFEPALESNPLLKLSCHDGLAYHLYRSPVDEAMARLPLLNAQMFDFIFQTFHPDIRVFSAIGSRSDFRRQTDDLTQNVRLVSQLLPTPSV